MAINSQQQYFLWKWIVSGLTILGISFLIYFFYFFFYLDFSSNYSSNYSQEFQYRYHRALELFSKKKYFNSQKEFDFIEPSDLSSKEKHAYLLLGAVLKSKLQLTTNFLTESLEQVEEASRIDNQPLNFLIKGLILKGQGEIRDSQNYFKQAVMADPLNPNFINPTVNGYFQLGSYDKALERAEKFKVGRNLQQKEMLKIALLQYFNGFSSEKHTNIVLPNIVEQNQEYSSLIQLLYGLNAIRNIIGIYQDLSPSKLDLKNTTPPVNVVTQLKNIKRFFEHAYQIPMHFSTISWKLPINLFRSFLYLNGYNGVEGININFTHRTENILNNFSRVSTQSWESSFFYEQLGDLFISKKNFSKAIHYYNKITYNALNSSPSLIYRKALSYYHLGKYSKAIDYLQTFNTPDEPPSQDFFLSESERSPYISSNSAVSISPLNIRFYSGALRKKSLQKMLENRTKSNQYFYNKNIFEGYLSFQIFPRLAQKIRELEFQNQTDEIVVLLNRELPNYIDAPYNQIYYLKKKLADAYYEKGKFNEANYYYREIIKVIGIEINRLQEYQSPSLTRILTLKKLLAETLNYIAFIELKKSIQNEVKNKNMVINYVLAETLLEKAFSINPNGVYLYNLYLIYRALGNNNKAFQSIIQSENYLSSIKDKSLQIEILLSVANMYAQKNQFIVAREFLKKAYKINPQDIRVLYLLKNGFTKKNTG